MGSDLIWSLTPPQGQTPKQLKFLFVFINLTCNGLLKIYNNYSTNNLLPINGIDSDTEFGTLHDRNDSEIFLSTTML